MLMLVGMLICLSIWFVCGLMCCRLFWLFFYVLCYSLLLIYVMLVMKWFDLIVCSMVFDCGFI